MFALAAPESGILSSSYGPPGMRCISVKVTIDTTSNTPDRPPSLTRIYRPITVLLDAYQMRTDRTSKSPARCFGSPWEFGLRLLSSSQSSSVDRWTLAAPHPTGSRSRVHRTYHVRLAP